MNWNFDEAFSMHNGRLLAMTVKQLGGDLQTAADLVSTVWQKSWERRETFSPERGSVGAWLNCIRRSAIADYFRAKRETLPLVAEPAAPDDGRPDLETAIGKLPEPWSKTIRLIYLEDRTFTEAAKILGVSVSCVHGRAKHGLHRLQRILAA